jgi:hypothetical protein
MGIELGENSCSQWAALRRRYKEIGKGRAIRADQLGSVLQCAELGISHIIGKNDDDIRLRPGGFLSGNSRHRSGLRQRRK